jgi:Protein of unknown function (DUF1367)
MPKINLILGDDNKLQGLSLSDQRAWSTFKFKVRNLGDSCIVFEYKEPRSGPFHRRHFAMLKSIFESQDAFDDPRIFRKWAEMSAGYAIYVPKPDGEMIAIPDSISYERLEQQEFQEIHEKVFAFLRSEHARRMLWPMMTDSVSEQMLEAILSEFK